MQLYVTQGSGNSLKPVLALTQTGQSCGITFVDVLGGETRKAPYLKINPAGAVPFLALSEGGGIGQSNAILWYIAEGTELMPHSSMARARALQWMFYEQTVLEPNISPARFFTHIVPERGEEHRAAIPVWQQKAREGLAFLDRYLDGRRFIASDRYSIGDIAVFGYTHLSGEAGIDLTNFPHIQRWIDRVENTPGFQPISILLDPAREKVASLLP